jgi:prophage antirepressor-like protein
MDNTGLISFNFQDRPLRVVDIDGEPWFVAKDVAGALGYEWQPNLVSHVPAEWKGSNPINTLGGIQQMLCLSEPGLYFFLGRSDKPLALPYQKWIAGDVVPSIRKKGFYAAPGKDREEQDEWEIAALETVLKELETRLAKHKENPGYTNGMMGAIVAVQLEIGLRLEPPNINYPGERPQ